MPAFELWRYCATVLPRARHELRRWRRHATRIPDPRLRAHACATLREEARNAEGAALLALSAPRARRAVVVRLLVTAQVLYDYLDTLSEQPSSDPLAAGRRLHGALRAALTDAGEPTRSRDWYAGYRVDGDAGYLAALVARCRALRRTLPAFAVVAPAVRRAVERASEGQSANHAMMLGALEPAALAAWAAALSPGPFRWWELSAAAGSSLALHALLAAAADPRLATTTARRVEAAYWPWTCALNTLLESIADEAADRVSGNHCYARHYRCPQVAAERLAGIAAHAAAAVRALPNASHHRTVLAAMGCFYLADGGAHRAWPAAVRERVLPQLAPNPRPFERVLALRRRLG